jgi:hypothetical protein
MGKGRAEVPPAFDMKAFYQSVGYQTIQHDIDRRFGVQPTEPQIRKWASRNQVPMAWAMMFASTFAIPIETLLPLAVTPDYERARVLSGLALASRAGAA